MSIIVDILAFVGFAALCYWIYKQFKKERLF